MLKTIRNPFFIYILGFTLSFLVYSLGWSDLYPTISGSMKLFFAITFSVFILFGVLVSKSKFIGKTLAATRLKNVRFWSFVLFFFYFLELLIEKDIPIISKLLGLDGIGYREFGVPILHGMLISFNSFLIAHSFVCYMSTNSRKFLFLNILLYIPAVLILSRSIMVLGAVTSLFIYIHFAKKLSLPTIIKLGVLILFGLYLFGVLGNLRSGGDYIYTQSKATEEFMESNIPKEYYWTYLYVSSPLANFQNTVNLKRVNSYSFSGFVFYEGMPQIISKNLGEKLGIAHRELVRIAPWLTVGTAYAKSFAYMKWSGPYMLVFYHLFIYFFLIVFLVPKSSSYHITVIAILSVIVLMSIFANILTVTGIFFQLAYCTLFSLFEGKKLVIKS